MTLTRREKLLGGLDVSKLLGVEIGALANPFVRKDEGQVLYVDWTNREALVEKYKDDPHVITEDIVHVDAIWGDNTLDDAVKGRKVDYVVASHVIEHVPDMITWLSEIRSILKDTGSVRLIIPDRRFTFDFLREETRLSDLLASYVVRSRMPQPYSVIDHGMNVAAVSCPDAWHGLIERDKLQPNRNTGEVLDMAREVVDLKKYHDVHCWVFTPISFIRLMKKLAEIGLLDFACERFFDTEYGYFDFFITLKPSSDLPAILESWSRAEADAKPHIAEASVKAAQAERERQDSEAATLRENFEVLSKHAADLESRLQESIEARAALSEELKRVQTSQASAEALLAQSRKRVADLEASTSWRITKPLRTAITRVRGIR